MGPKLTNPAKNTYCYAGMMAAQSPYDALEKEYFALVYQGDDTAIKNGKCNLTSPAAVAALKYWLRLVNDLKIFAPGVFTNRSQDRNEQFVAEQTALINNAPAHVTIVQRRNPKLKFGLAPLPEGKTHGTVVGGWNVCMGRSGKNKEAAWEFIHWLVGPEGSAKMTLAAKHLPGNAKADISELLEADPRLKVPAQVLVRGRCFAEAAALPEAVNLYRILVEQIHEAATKRKTVEQALAFATAEWNQIIAKHA
jgi:ABC-type glycerol-3-phosphate transport system substrate-binding protein